MAEGTTEESWQGKDFLDRESLLSEQYARLRPAIDLLLAQNPFYRDKLEQAGLTSGSDLTAETFLNVPFTTKEELSSDQDEHPPYGRNLTYPLTDYTRLHQTSGTTGRPLRWLDDREGWEWFGKGWRAVFEAAGVGQEDRIFFAFSFGPFIGFWSAFEGCRQLGALALPGGAMNSHQRLLSIVEHEATVLCSTPTYALRLAEVAAEERIDLPSSSVRVTIHAGEPGAGIPNTRNLIENAWGAKAFDHAGATEVGPWGYDCQEQTGLHLNEGEFIFEVIDPDTGDPATEGELVITNLGRLGSPVLRYRTGDHVKLSKTPCPCGRTFRSLEGGVMGRIDDVLIVRGVNVYPSAIENVIRTFPEVDEFAADVYRKGAMDDLRLRLEVTRGDGQAVARAVERAIRDRLGLRVDSSVVAPGDLPRFELKAKRFHDHRVKEGS
jgi:phenylacetate-CoA ligase